jgi:hypothetical protein
MLSWTSGVQDMRGLIGRQCEGVLAHLEQDVDGFVGAAVVELATGRPLATHCVQPNFDIAAVIRIAVLTMRMHQGVADDEGCALEEIAVADAQRFHLYHLLSRSALLVVSAQRSRINMAMLRAVVRRRATPLAEARSPRGQDDALHGPRQWP